jgi:FixJ family two-component response regulator
MMDMHGEERHALYRRTPKKNTRGTASKFFVITRPLISVVDDDESARESLPDLLHEFGFDAQAFSSAEEFLASESIGETRCLLLDVAMPGMSGPDLQRELRRQERSIPIVFITAHRDATVRPRMIAEGAVDCLNKPFEATDLLQALNTALRAS